MSSLETLVESLKRSIAVPGTFADNFPETTDDDLTLTLLDGFAEAQLDGFFGRHESTEEGEVTPDLNRAEGALVVMYATVRVLMSELKNSNSHIRYEAGGAVFEQDKGTNLLRDLLKEATERKKELREIARLSGLASAFHMADGYFLAATGRYSNLGGAGYEDRAYDYGQLYDPHGF